jgi:ABC-type bacteriocin/lantibiotic exporter with double-glycine peptidase domain
MCADNSEIPSHLAFFAAFYFCMIGFLGAFLNFWEFVPVKSLYERLKPIIQSDVESDFNTEQLDNFYGNVELSHVFYHYDDSDVEVIKDVSLKVECGDFIVISGASGSGKTSLVELIIGFFVPSKGAVYYDDFDLKLLNKTSVRKHVGVVLQKSQIEEASIMDNILKGTNYGIDEARRVASLVGLTEEIEQMPMGFHTLVNKRNISKGQQQKILIAKALVGKPCLLIMDEATSSLDNISQKLIMDRIAGLNITRIVISNRISTVKSADFIYVMKDGTIESKGTFRELCKTSELFRSLIS